MKTSTLIRTRIEYIRNAKLSRQQLEEKQVKKFRRLVAYANQHAPYYQDIIRDRGINVKTCLPQDFPILTKPESQDNFTTTILLVKSSNI